MRNNIFYGIVFIKFITKFNVNLTSPLGRFAITKE